MDAATLVSVLDFARMRLLSTLDAIQKSGQPEQKVLLWRPAANRAHIAWQAMHCAATHARYFQMTILGQAKPNDEALIAAYAGGSTPSDNTQPSIEQIKSALQANYAPLRDYVSRLAATDLERVVGTGERQRKLGDAIILLAWHEAHHQGQIHLTWNAYRQINGLV